MTFTNGLEKKVSYTATNTYSVLNEYSDKTKNVWIVFHGMGYLSKYFINYFSELNSEENFIIAPQAPAKYYQDSNFKRIGASWLTRENTEDETKNILRYMDKIFETEIPKEINNLIVMGYSQGVSIATRWVASRKINCNHLLLHSGGIPKELKKEDFDFLNPKTKVTYLYGDNDPYITEARKTEAHLQASELFGKQLKVEVFQGVHEVNTNFLKELAK
ncbi:alpha/beta hydrolase [Aequorivita echinoideorum]|uniref:Esterase n=1 Tax=Aequorivita echinoideorum TaxID=1549647 RepID=A0ABS5S6X5_9FLAO|nr:esterase [Aequorivita echinoideorum]MBT0608956.1 esterase [Aequorivita echinoideorum]